MGGQRSPAQSTSKEEHVPALIGSGHVHDEASADFADELQVGVDAGGSRTAAANAILVGVQEVFIDRKGGKLDVGFLWIFALESPAWVGGRIGRVFRRRF